MIPKFLFILSFWCSLSLLSLRYIGILPEDDYNAMIARRPFNNTTPPNFPGYNAGTPFPYWCSKPLTLAVSMLSIGKADLLLD